MIIFINTVSIKIVLLFEIKEVYLFIPRESFRGEYRYFIYILSFDISVIFCEFVVAIPS